MPVPLWTLNADALAIVERGGWSLLVRIKLASFALWLVFDGLTINNTVAGNKILERIS